MIDKRFCGALRPSAIDRFHTAQNRVLTALLNNLRFGWLVEQEMLDGNTMRTGLWRELDSPQVKTDAAGA